MDAVMTVDGVDTVGAMSGGSNNMVAMAGSNAATDNTTFTYYVLLGDKAPKAQGRGAGDLRQNSRSKLRN